MLFGNGYKITNLSVSNVQYGKLFGYNAGSIIGLTIEGASLSITNVENAALGETHA